MTTDIETTLFRFLLNSSACMHPVCNMPQLNVKQWLPHKFRLKTKIFGKCNKTEQGIIFFEVS